MNRTAIAVWKGTIKEGAGILSTQSGALDENPFSFASRFTNGTGTSSEELLAAAHAACFAMKLSLDLSVDGFVPELLETQCTISLIDGTITASQLVLSARIPGLNETQFTEYAAAAKINCPVSRAFNFAIGLEAMLIP